VPYTTHCAVHLSSCDDDDDDDDEWLNRYHTLIIINICLHHPPTDDTCHLYILSQCLLESIHSSMEYKPPPALTVPLVVDSCHALFGVGEWRPLVSTDEI